MFPIFYSKDLKQRKKCILEGSDYLLSYKFTLLGINITEC